MGLSVDDFLGLDTDEFDAAVKAFGEHEDQQERERWERMRLLGLLTVQPWSKGKLTAEKLLPLPWDKEQRRSRCLQNRAGDGALKGNKQDGALKGTAQNHGGQGSHSYTEQEGAQNHRCTRSARAYTTDGLEDVQSYSEQEERRLTKAEHRARAEEMLKLLGERY